MSMHDNGTAIRSGVATANPEMEQRIGDVGIQLTDAIADLLDALPGGERRTMDVARALGVNKNVASKLLIAMRQRDPIASTYHMPGPEALRKILDGARKRINDKAVLGRFEDAIVAFERLMSEETGGRASLDAIISAWLPEARARFELGNKQAAFKAMSSLKGVMMDTYASTRFIHPSADGKRHDVLAVSGFMGVRRLTPGAHIYLWTQRFLTEADEVDVFTVDREPVDRAGRNMLLKGYGSEPKPELEFKRFGKDVGYLVKDDGIGVDSAFDMFFGELSTNRLHEKGKPPESDEQWGKHLTLFVGPDMPAKRMIFDVLLHKDAWTDNDPELSIRDAAMSGFEHLLDPESPAQEMNVLEAAQYLGRGVRVCRSSHIPMYVDLLKELCEKQGWDPAGFRCYRCQIEYPIYGTMAQMRFRW